MNPSIRGRKRDLHHCQTLTAAGKARLARRKRRCMGLARAERRSVLIGTHAHLGLERSGEVTLIEKARSEGDISKRCARVQHFVANELKAPLQNVLRDRAAIKSAELTREMNWMNAHRRREITK